MKILSYKVQRNKSWKRDGIVEEPSVNIYYTCFKPT